MSQPPLSYESPRPWSISQKPFKIIDANGATVASLTTLDKANAELIVRCVNGDQS